MEYKKEKMHPFFKLIIILFIIFLGYFIALESGYYPSFTTKKTIQTENQMKVFEDGISKGDIVKNDGYIEKDDDYSNFVTKTGNALTFSLGKMITGGMKGIKEVSKILFR